MESFPAMYNVKTYIFEFRILYIWVFIWKSHFQLIFFWVTFMIPHLLKMSGVIRESSDESDESNMDIADLIDIRGVNRGEDRGSYRK